MTGSVKQVDSLSANEFAVELDGVRLEGIFKISGFIPFKLDVKPVNQLKQVQDAFKIVRMVRRDPAEPMNAWLRDTVSAGADIARPKRTLTIIAVDDGLEIRRWTLSDAWVSEIAYSEFDTGSSELVQETLTIRWDSVQETWL
jgi:hypothetical protein